MVSVWRLGALRISTLRGSWGHLRDVGRSHGGMLLLYSIRTRRYLWNRHNCSIIALMPAVRSESVDLQPAEVRLEVDKLHCTASA